MTQPSLNKTFDTSLVDLSPLHAHESFSTTESAPSEDYKQALDHQVTSTGAVPPPLRVSSPKFEEASTSTRKMPTRYVPTVEAYDSWAEVYDSDGNVLQAVDDDELGDGGGMLRDYVMKISELSRPGTSLNIVDLGCGTGRNTVALMSQDWPSHMLVNITGIDASRAMLNKAAMKLEAAKATLDPEIRSRRTLTLLQHDFLDPVDANRPPILLDERSFVAASSDLSSPILPPYDGLLTTLVLEHFPLPTFFALLASLIKPDGIALLTNMHYNMGMRSQAGFVAQDEDGQAIKVRGTSWVHGTSETVDEAAKAGFTVIGQVKERTVTEEMVEKKVVGERGRKWIGVKVWYGMLLRKVK
ncbi:uncharacterized protein PV09_05081 [Verruconis gallopava]|uniref:Methyltransferase domain-containing protein n=1 Tax=Verruconis gallopava TaxID=253628 RepID=A0A0D2AAH7_9PEZI|nr:uncharacterized protein PV09_05081 [Verruconis gallopava]KIW03778.1 hypothetical protein PV09_05081 [Verruconis gallopava]